MLKTSQIQKQKFQKPHNCLPMFLKVHNNNNNNNTNKAI